MAEELQSRDVFRRLVGMLRPYWPVIATGVALLLVAAPCDLFPAFIWKYVVDDVALQKHSMPRFHRLMSLNGHIHARMALFTSALVWLYGVYLIGQALETVEGYIMNRLAQKFILRLRNQVYHKLQSQTLAYLQRQRTGDLMSRVMGDVDELQSFIVNAIDVIFGEGMMWLATVYIVMRMDWRVASASLAPLLIVYVLLRMFNKRVKPIYAAARQRLGDVSTRLQENLSGVVVIKTFGREREEAERFGQATRDAYDQQIKALGARSTFFPLAQAVGFLSNVAMIGVGGYFMISNGSFTPGTALAFRAYWWRLFGPVQTLARVNDMIQRALAACRRVFEVLDAPDELPERPDARDLAEVRGDVELRNVSFQYDGEPGKPRPLVLRDVNLTIASGRTVALCGPSGAGKSTVLNLLLRFYDPTAGELRLDGWDLRQVRRESLRKHCALVQQETFLFNDSILDNIRYGRPQATLEQVVAAAQAANAHEFISALPAGYDTKVGERGIRLSGGQKQRISIARAFLANPHLLLLDEPTSSVEPDSEAAIIAALRRLMAGRTTVLTSHRPSLILGADVVYVIEDGRVTEQGTPEQLRAHDGWFSRFIGQEQLAPI